MYFSRRYKNLTTVGLQTSLSQGSQYSAENRNLQKTGSTLSHANVFAPKQCLCQKEAMGMESLKMYCSRRCKNLNYLCETAYDPISSEPV